MRVQVAWFGLELDFYLGPTTVDDECACTESGTDPGSFTSNPVGFCHSIEPDWEKPLNRLDPGDDDEDRANRP